MIHDLSRPGALQGSTVEKPWHGPLNDFSLQELECEKRLLTRLARQSASFIPMGVLFKPGSKATFPVFGIEACTKYFRLNRW